MKTEEEIRERLEACLEERRTMEPNPSLGYRLADEIALLRWVLNDPPNRAGEV